MATITRATVETQSPWVEPGRGATARSSRRRRLRGTAVALLAALVCAWAPAPASAQTTVDTPEALTIGGRFGLSGYEIPFTPGDEKDVRAQWYTGVRLSLDIAKVSEDGGRRQVIVTANVSTWGVRLFAPTVIEVTVGKSGDSAVSGTDYRAVPKFNVTIPKARQGGHTSFYLEPLGDAEWEGAEQITIHGRHVTDHTPDPVAGTTLTVTDEGDSPYTGSQVFLSVNPSKVSEADSATTVEVTARSDAQSVSRRVMVTLSDGVATATWGVDYQIVHNFDITLPANAVSATGTFTLTPIQDTLAEGDETITIKGQVDGHDSGVTGTTLTLTDDDAPPAVTLSASPSSVTENGGAKTVTVTATSAAAASNARTVLVAVGNPVKDTATPGTDYATVPNFTITIPANATTATGSFVLTPTNDTTTENAESISIGGAPESAGAAFTVGGTAMTLTDDDALSAVTLSAAPASVSEGADPTTVTVTATAASAVAWARKVRVVLGTGASTATMGVDYKLVPNFDITIAANATSGTGTFTLTPIQDTTNEGNETIAVSGQSPRTTVTGTTVTLADDDIHPPVTLSVSPSSVSEGAGATTVTVTATVTTARASAFGIIATVGGSGDSAVSGTDYSVNPSQFFINVAAGQTSATNTFTLTPTQDTAVEGGETISVSGVTSGTTVTGAAVMLTDDDSYPAVTLSANPSTVGEDAGATSVTVTATATSSVATARTVTVSVGQTGTAASGADYAAVPDFTIAIAANATTGTGTFTLTPTQDTVVEGSETIGVSGSSPSTTVTGTTLTITDDDNYPAVTLSADPASVGEEASATTVTVTATTTSSVATARTVTVSVGGSGTATSGTDYTAVSDFTITIAANATSGTGTFTLTPTQDTTYEGNETIGVAGTSPSTTVTGTTLTLIDDELPTITLSHWPNNPINEWSAQNYTITATRPESAKGSAVSVTVSVGAGDDETINYATPGTDYHTVPDFTITIAANATSGSANVRISAIRDSHYEGFEWFWFSGTATGYKVTGTGMYIIDDQLPSVVLTASPSSVSEGASATQVTVTAKAQENLGSAYTVTVRVGGSQTATSGTDYAAVSNFTITIPGNGTGAMGTFTLTPTDDILIEGDETISVWGSTNGLSVVGTTLTLTDDDQPTIALSASPSSVSEGASATQVTVTATAVAAKSTARTVTVSVGDTGTATSGTDYAAVSDFDITIAANATSGTGTFTLTPTQDTAVESNETIGVAGASANTNVAGTTLTLTDDENPAVTLSANPSSVSEGASATSVTVTATAVSAMTTARTVTVSVGDGGTATSGTDYAAVSDFDITIATNATSGTGTFTLTPTQDAANEGDETVGVSGTSTGATVTGTTITLTDIDLPRITLETVPANLRVVENATQSSVIVRATTAAPVKAETTVTLTVGASGDGATKTTDYTASNVGTITLRANGARGEASFDLTPVQDTLVENDETISVSGSSSGGHTVTGTSLTLIDDDSYPAVTLSAAPSSVGEGASATSVTVTATAKSAMSSARTVTVSVGDTGTATSGTDYAAVSDFTVTIAANAKTGTGTFTLTPTQDTTVEGSETIGVAGTSTQSTVTGTTVTLTDDDSYPAITLSANPSSVGEGAIGTATLVTVTASSSAMSSARTVTVSVGGSGTATRGTDYATVADFTVTIAANATSGTGTFNLTPTQDTAVEGSETVGVAGASPSSTVTGTTVTLTDDDTHAIDLSASPSTVAEDKTSETITVTATINAARTAATTVTVSVGDSGDQAKSGTDYKAVSDFTVTIAANKTSGTGTFTFEPKTDTAYEGLESVTISGTTSQSGGGGAAAFGASAANSANASTGIPVTDTSLSIHDASNYPSVTLSANPASVGEGASATSVTVTATATSAIASSREVTVSVGDSGTATSGTDYTAVTDFIIKIAANKKSGTGTFTLTPTQDNVVEGSETISVSATSLSTSVTGTTVTLTDDDRATVTVNDANANEGSDMTFTVTLNRGGRRGADGDAGLHQRDRFQFGLHGQHHRDFLQR